MKEERVITTKRKLIVFLFTGIVLVLMGIAVYSVYLRGFENIRSIYILNIGVDFIGMAVGYILFVICLIDSQKSGMSHRYFYLLLIVVFVGLYSDLFAWVVDYVPELIGLNYATNTVYYLCSPLAAFVLWHYIMDILGANRKNNLSRLMLVCLLLDVLARILNLFFGFYFTVDAHGVYHRSALQPISMVYPFFMSVVAFVVIVKNRKKLESIELLAFMIYLLAPTAVEILTIAVYGLSISYAVLMMGLLFMYGMLNISQGRKKAIADRDLTMAREIQDNVLPSIFPTTTGRESFDLHAMKKPAKETGGDFYDFFLLDEQFLALIIAEVSDRGVPAALYMMITKTLLRSRLQAGDSPARVLETVNRQLLQSEQLGIFVCASVMVIDINGGRGLIASAGHELPFLRRGGGGYERVRYPRSLPLGKSPDVVYEEHLLRLNRGDSLFTFTKGVTEARNREGEVFGEKGIFVALNESRDKSPEEVVNYVLEKIQRFGEDMEQPEDMTMMCLRLR